MRREKEGPSRVHFDSKILRVKWMNLHEKRAIKVADLGSCNALFACLWHIPLGVSECQYILSGCQGG